MVQVRVRVRVRKRVAGVVLLLVQDVPSVHGGRGGGHVRAHAHARFHTQTEQRVEALGERERGAASARSLWQW